jgi:hypothetical protein
MTLRRGMDYYVCNGCGKDSRDDAERIRQSVGNAFVSVDIQNMATGDDVTNDVHICSRCWCKVQIVIDGQHRLARERAREREDERQALEQEERDAPWNN